MPKGDKEILKADPEDGTTPLANLLLVALAVAKLTGKEKGAVLYLWRVTYGWLVDGKRLKEAVIPLANWSKVLQTDDAKSSKIMSGLVNKQIILRKYLGPGKSYSYSMNTRVAEWDRGCLNRQVLSEIARQGLPKRAGIALPKKAIVPDTNLATPKDKLNKELKKDNSIDRDINIKDDNQVKNSYEDMAEITVLYEAEIGKITPLVVRELNDAMQNYPEEMIKEAIKEAVKQNKRTWNYVLGILKNWGKERPENSPSKNVGRNRKNPDDPDKFIKGKYGNMVRR